MSVEQVVIGLVGLLISAIIGVSGFLARSTFGRVERSTDDLGRRFDALASKLDQSNRDLWRQLGELEATVRVEQTLRERLERDVGSFSAKWQERISELQAHLKQGRTGSDD